MPTLFRLPNDPKTVTINSKLYRADLSGTYKVLDEDVAEFTRIGGTVHTNSTIAARGLDSYWADETGRVMIGPDGSSVTIAWSSDLPPTSTTVAVGSSRALTNADNGKTLECTATVTLTVPIGLVAHFGCAIIPSGTTSIASSGGALLNGATSTLTRTVELNQLVAIVARVSAADSYVVTGA